MQNEEVRNKEESRVSGFTVPELGRALGISKTKAWQLIYSRQIGFYRVGRRIYVSQKHIDQFLAANEVKPSGPKKIAQRIMSGKGA
jgi:excisionase family DNA binding protein